MNYEKIKNKLTTNAMFTVIELQKNNIFELKDRNQFDYMIKRFKEQGYTVQRIGQREFQVIKTEVDMNDLINDNDNTPQH